MVKTIHINWKQNGIIAVTTRRLTEPQYRAYCKLTSKWQNAMEPLDENLKVLDRLVRMGLAEKKFMHGYMQNPRSCYDYKKTEMIDDDK